MPFLPSGDYSISCALAEGSQDEHIQLHWIEDALFFKVLSSHIVHGLIGVPMHDINITVNARSERAHVEGV
jgi:lipopolysaccharide transport system ATP-binding protein